MIQVGSIVQIKKYPEWGVYQVIGYNPNLDVWELSGQRRQFTDDELVFVRES